MSSYQRKLSKPPRKTNIIATRYYEYILFYTPLIYSAYMTEVLESGHDSQNTVQYCDNTFE